MTPLLLVALATPSTVNPADACRSASRVLLDMRYVEGRRAEPGDFSHPKIAARLERCEKVARLAAPHGPDVTFAAIAVAYNETNFREGVPGKAGELGMMQVLPGYHCKPYPDLRKGKGCTDPLRAGVRALRLLLADHGTERALQLYNGSSAYARKVAGYARAARRSWERRREL